MQPKPKLKPKSKSKPVKNQTHRKTPQLAAKSSARLAIKDVVIVALCIVMPVTIGIISGDAIIGSALLTTGLLSSYLCSIGKRAGCIFGTINALLMAYVAFNNGLYGTCITSILLFAPMELTGFFIWGRNLDGHKYVKVNRLTPSKSAVVLLSCFGASAFFGYLLTLIPGQQLAFMDSAVDCLDVCALILMNLRYKEAWPLWIASGLLSVIVWTITLINGGDGAFMFLLTAIGFLSIDTYGMFKWYKKSKT